mmetsp:Transcript_20442/g.38268  ORF Transcript_20442/g.38268 Transcript_20442/m.38268 type:complete len:96 (-) Transcript_20442:7925-8212(-)
MSVDEIRQILADDTKLNEVVKAAFESVDTDGSGYIDAPELKKVMSSVAGDIGMPEPSDADVLEVMQELDANNDGKISEDEFKVLIKQVLELMLST